MLFGTESAMNMIASATLDIASEPIRKSDSGSITINSAANKRYEKRVMFNRFFLCDVLS